MTRGVKQTQPECSVADCRSAPVAMGWCGKHYQRNRIHGSPLDGRTPHGDALRFFYQALASDTDDCVVWPYTRQSKGYGQVTYNGEVVLTHRLMCRLANGDPISADMQATHECGHGGDGCINPRHLVWGTPRKNSDDVAKHGHRQRGSAASRAKLIEPQVLEIRGRLANGETQGSIAKVYGISAGAVCEIKAGRNWGWLK
jgi:hypothetical protein